MSEIVNVTQDNFEEEVLKSDIPVLVDFWAAWCHPCLMMGPILEELSEEMKDKLKIAKVNIEDPLNQLLAVRYQIQSIPNMKLFKNGMVVKEFIGVRPKEIFKRELEEELRSSNE